MSNKKVVDKECFWNIIRTLKEYNKNKNESGRFLMMMANVRENLVVGGVFGCLIGSLFLAFGGISNFLCEMLFWSFVLYVGVTYFEFVPNFVKVLVKRYSAIAYYLSYLSWVPLAVGGAVVVFLTSLLFVDYDIKELSCLLKSAKISLSIMMFGSAMSAYVKKSDRVKLVFGI